MRSIDQKINKSGILILAFLLCGSVSAFAEGKATLRDLSIDAHYMMLGVLGTGLPPAVSELTLTKIEASTDVPVVTLPEPKPIMLPLNSGLLPATAGMHTSTDKNKE